MIEGHIQEEQSFLPFGFQLVWPLAQLFNPLGGSVFEAVKGVVT